MSRHSACPAPAVAVCALLATLASPSLASDDWKQQISRDYVRVDDGKFVFDEYDICTFSLPARLAGRTTRNLQVRTYAEAPAQGVLSRDYFLLVVGQYSMALMMGLTQVKDLTPQEAAAGLECRTLDAPVGTVDLEIKLVMAANGIQMEFVDTSQGKSDRVTTPWSDLYPSTE